MRAAALFLLPFLAQCRNVATPDEKRDNDLSERQNVNINLSGGGTLSVCYVYSTTYITTRIVAPTQPGGGTRTVTATVTGIISW